MTYTDDVNAALMGGGKVKSASFEKVGDFLSGTIVRRQMKQQTEYGSNEPLFWDEGKPKMQIVVIVQTPDQDDEDDNGERGVYIKLPSQMAQAVREAVAAAGADGLMDGGVLTLKYTGNRKSPKNPKFTQKVYEAAYRPPAFSTPIPDEDDAPPF